TTTSASSNSSEVVSGPHRRVGRVPTAANRPCPEGYRPAASSVGAMALPTNGFAVGAAPSCVLAVLGFRSPDPRPNPRREPLMLVPLEWLREYCDPELSTDELAARLTLTGTKTARWFRHGPPAPDHYVVGRVLEAVAHPNADRLRVCRVELGLRRFSAGRRR